QVAEPKTAGDFRVGVMRANRVKRQEQQDQAIRQIRELEVAVGREEYACGRKNKQVFQKPITAIDRMNCERHPEDRVAGKSDLQKMVVAEMRAGLLHRPVLLRFITATAAIITSDPSRAESISFCASHSSPCPPSQSTPFPGATISATTLSIISKQPLTARIITTGNARLQTPRGMPLNRRSNSRIENASRNPNAP